MPRGTVRIGIVGAGGIVRSRHVPGFRAIRGVELVGVCNRRRDSSARAARELGLAKTYGNWEEVIQDPTVDAVLIGAWPYLHCPVTLAALDAGKHVLTQARMAMNAREAQRMLDRTRELPGQVAMVVPSPYGLAGEAFVRSLIAEGFLGNLREVHVDGLTDELADPEVPLSWRQKTRYSGFNMLTLGILHETVQRWLSPPVRVLAYASKLITERFDPESSKLKPVGTPDSVQVLATHEDGSVATYRLSAVLWGGRSLSVALHGSEGSLFYDLLKDEIRGVRRGEESPRVLPIPEALRGGWRAEADFIAAIRGERPVTHTDFATGARYMQFTEAVARSSRHQVPVTLPLKEFSNPSL
ncbi:Gfo/Idh/MocA family protein [Paludisphaera mucosa]|uniref:Gfo/Idh/MocA family oxidoreductase n=1 Tax=Paludisphaera mucosa TaxID=3030827 RepID=A0ABT6F7P9_9BACT|nr:Gfo/Idh/MocA family oxidoreductase [Paludisphaera mucosa]MDG3003430.1 Gfo/Idh/MocA family oxidoreductase [Paludisphaera mucosa]